jgi:hypothetical protein
MKSVAENLDNLFRTVRTNFEALSYHQEGAEVCAELNDNAARYGLLGRLLVIEPNIGLGHPSSREIVNGNVFIWGRLGGFALEQDQVNERYIPVVILMDYCGDKQLVQNIPVRGAEMPHDVEQFAKDSGALGGAKDVIASPAFTFPELADACRQVGTSNIERALFCAALNDFAIPQDLASRIVISSLFTRYISHLDSEDERNVKCYVEDTEISPCGLSLLQHFAFEPRDRFGLVVSTDNPSLAELVVTSRVPLYPYAPYRQIRIDRHVVAHE